MRKNTNERNYPTLAEFLGWEEGHVYQKENGDLYKIEGDEFYLKSPSTNTWRKDWLRLDKVSLNEYRQFKKLEKKYYAKNKLEMLNSEIFCYIFRDNMDTMWITSGKSVADKRTMEDWAMRGITEDIVEFEEC